MPSLVNNVVTFVELFTDIALSGPISAFLLLSGTLLFVVSFGVFAYLALGALVDLVVPETVGQTPPEGH